MDPLESSETKSNDLQKSLSDALKDANAEDLQRALDALKKNK